MTKRQQWLLKRLLIPAGVLPPGITHEDLVYVDNLRSKIGNIGFEYFYTVDQDPNKVNSSPIGKKIFAMHAPWPKFGPIERSPEPLRTFGYKIFFGKSRLPTEFEPMAQKSYEFAKAIGAKVITFHATFFNHKNIVEELAALAKLEEKFNITAAIEHEGSYMHLGDSFDTNSFKKVDGSLNWLIDPVKMISALDMIYPRKKFKICFDTASQISSGIDIVNSVRKCLPRITHVHLASNPVGGHDLAWEIDRPDIVEVAKILYEKNYKGFITAEVAAYIGDKEGKIAMLHAMTSVLGIKPLKNKAIGFTQTHSLNSCNYLLNHI